MYGLRGFPSMVACFSLLGVRRSSAAVVPTAGELLVKAREMFEEMFGEPADPREVGGCVCLVVVAAHGANRVDRVSLGGSLSTMARRSGL